MGEEILGFSSTDDPLKIPSSLEDFEMDLEDLLRESQQQRRSREINMIRSGSAPPTVEGSRTAFGNLFGDPCFNELGFQFNSNDGFDQRMLMNDRRSPFGEEIGLPHRSGLRRNFYSESNEGYGIQHEELIAPSAIGLNARKSFADVLQNEHVRDSYSGIHQEPHLVPRGPREDVFDRGIPDMEMMDRLKMRSIGPGIARAQSFTSPVSNPYTGFAPPRISRSITPDPLLLRSATISSVLGRRNNVTSSSMADHHDFLAAVSALNLSSGRAENEGNLEPQYSPNLSYLRHSIPANYRAQDNIFSNLGTGGHFGLQNDIPLNQSVGTTNNIMDQGFGNSRFIDDRKCLDPLLLQYLRRRHSPAHSRNDPSLEALLALQQLQQGVPSIGMGGSIGHGNTRYQEDISSGHFMPPISSLHQGERYSRLPATMRRPPAGPTGPWNPDNGPPVTGYGSSLLEEFKNNKTRSFELSEIVGHVVEFSADQHGSRFIQQKLEVASDVEKDKIFSEIIPHARALMNDVFGNYVIQKFFEHGTKSQRRELADQLIGHVLQLSLQMYGCRVIQKALEVVEVDQQTIMVSELDGSVMKCVRDQNGNHVIQKCIECVPQERIRFIISAFHGQVVPLSTHPYGCRVIQRVLEHCDDMKTQSTMMDEILQAVSALSQDQYGNYVIQHVIQHGRPEERAAVVEKLAGQIVKMSQQKFASNVVEKCLTFGTAEERQLIINEILGPNDENEPLQAIMKDQYGNYVVQRVMETCVDHNLELILSRIKAHVGSLKKYTYGKHIAARLEKVIAAGERRVLMSCT